MAIDTLGIVGCGTMGTGIAEVAVTHGLKVICVRATGGDASSARRAVAASLERLVGRNKLRAEDRDAALARLELGRDLEALRACDLVLESALEDLDAKTALLRRVERALRDTCILATNTSSLPLPRLAAELARPGRFLALHFFSPAPVMKLVEVATLDATRPDVTAAAEELVRALGKTPVRVAGAPGYVVNRLLVPYLLHAVETLEASIATPGDIDAAMRLGCGHPMGPLALCDLIGLDVVLAMARSLGDELGPDRYGPPDLLLRLVQAGHLGRKTGTGFYLYGTDEPQPNPALLTRLRGGDSRLGLL